jgi:hypothetical protein
VLRYTLTIGAACSSYRGTRCGSAESHSLAVFINIIVYNATVLKPSSLMAMEDRYHKPLTKFSATETHFIQSRRGLDRYCYLGRKPLRKTYQRLNCVPRNIVKDKENFVFVKVVIMNVIDSDVT